jgi:hypothetical protein
MAPQNYIQLALIVLDVILAAALGIDVATRLAR